MDCVSEHISLNTLAELFVKGYLLYIVVRINRTYMSIDTSRRDMNKNIKWQSTLVNMCTSYQSLAMMILYDSRMTNVFLLKNFSFQEQLFHSQTQCLYIVLHFAGAKMISGLSSSTLFFFDVWHLFNAVWCCFLLMFTLRTTVIGIRGSGEL